MPLTSTSWSFLCALPKLWNLHHNHLHLQPWSSVILWFYYSIFKPVEWECFWVPCSHRWWWEESQEYVACSKCPFHYVITPFTFHMNRGNIILLTVTKKQVVNGSTTSTHMCKKHERRNSSQLHIPKANDSVHGKNVVQRDKITITAAPYIVGRGREGKAKGTKWMIKSYTMSLYSWYSKNILHGQIICQDNLSETKNKINVPTNTFPQSSHFEHCLTLLHKRAFYKTDPCCSNLNIWSSDPIPFIGSHLIILEPFFLNLTFSVCHCTLAKTISNFQYGLTWHFLPWYP